MHASLFDYTLTKHDEIFIEVEEGQRFVMRIFSCLNDSQLQEYVGMIQQIISGELKSSSFLGLENAVRRSKNSLPDIADFWVDVENDVALSFDKNFMIRLPFMMQRTIL
jgi:hypothetical protein